MTAGLPGTGISGFFYFVLVLGMPLIELYVSARGKSSLERWKKIGFYWMMTIAILAVVAIEYVALTAGLGWLQQSHTFFGSFLQWCTGGREILVGFRPFGMIISFLVLAGVLSFTYMVNLAQQWGLLARVAPVPATVREQGPSGGNS